MSKAYAVFQSAHDERGEFSRIVALEEVRRLGGREVYCSNEGERDISFAPDRGFILPDGSICLVSYQTMYVDRCRP